MEKKTVLVIGAGIGGIATAARLAHYGYQVTVVEKCDGPGGRCGAFIKEGHHFVNGPTLFLMPELYDQTFRDLGERKRWLPTSSNTIWERTAGFNPSSATS